MNPHKPSESPSEPGWVAERNGDAEASPTPAGQATTVAPALAEVARSEESLRRYDGRVRRLAGAAVLVFGLGGWLLWFVVRPHMVATAYLEMNQALVNWHIDGDTWTHGGWTEVDLTPAHSRARRGDLEFLPGLQRVEVLQLSDCGHITDQDLTALAPLTHLRVLSLNTSPELVFARAGPRITNAGLKHLSGLTGLRELNLDGTSIDDAGLAHLQTLSDLEQLELCSTDITDAGLRQLSKLKRLKTLKLRDTSITDAGIPQLAGLTRLQELDLSSTSVTDTSVPVLRALPALTRLSLEHTKLTVNGWTALASAHPGQEVIVDPQVSGGPPAPPVLEQAP